MGHLQTSVGRLLWDHSGSPSEACQRVDTVVLVGCNFPNCPRATAYGASMRDFRVMVVADAISGVYPRGLAELERIGIQVVPTQECLAWLPWVDGQSHPYG